MGVADTMQFIPLAVTEADPACQPKVMKRQVFCASKLMGSPEFYPQSPKRKEHLQDVWFATHLKNAYLVKW